LIGILLQFELVGEALEQVEGKSESWLKGEKEIEPLSLFYPSL